MQIKDDYFLLYHGLLELDNQNSFNLSSTVDYEIFIELTALFLSVHRRNFNLFSNLDDFKIFSQRFTSKSILTIEDLYAFQGSLIDQLQTRVKPKDLLKLNKAFLYLHESEIISQQQFEKLQTLFALSPSNTQKDEKIQSRSFDNFLDQKNIYIEDIKQLQNICKTDAFVQILNEILDYIKYQTFCIGITGVMNAGKSTLLNALIGEEILGSSVIAETANLTIITHSTKEFATVYYWDIKEWQAIQKSAKTTPSIQKFIDKTSTTIGDKLKDYISQPCITKDININDLALYTSANKSNYVCNLVKYVKLGMDLDFLSNGIEIVDTPGLDDIVVQREEITKEYMTKCDLMMHLMNVSQSATLIDVEFIIHSLLYGNVSALLIIITRADTVSKEELLEVINYTKHSIKQQLQALNEDNRLDFVLNAITFLPISAHMALLHRTNRADQALKAGFSLEKTGILEVEDYLAKTLFGLDNQKNKLLVHAIQIRIKNTIKAQIDSLHYELLLLNKSKEELEIELEIFLKQNSVNNALLSTLKIDIKNQEEQLLEYVKRLDNFIEESLRRLQALIKNRLLDDIKYTLSTEKKNLNFHQVKNIILVAMRDGIIDILRDYRYKCIKKMEAIQLYITSRYAKSKLEIEAKESDIDIGTFFKETFTSNFLSTNYEQLIIMIFECIKKAKLKKMDITAYEIESILKENILSLKENILKKAHNITQILLDDFFKALELPLLQLQKSSTTKEKMITKHISSFKLNESYKEQKALQHHHTIRKLKTFLKGY